MVAPYLPQEIVEQIIDMLVGDPNSLLSCSLVSTSWVHRSRHHLLAHIKLNSLSDLQLWFTVGLEPSSHHVRSLDLAQDEFRWIAPETLATIPNDFTPFYNVRSLSLTGMDLTLFDERSLTRFFGNFSERLTSLSVNGLTAHPDTLLFFISMFPNLDNLKLDYLTMGRTKSTAPFRYPAATPKFRGKLTLSNLKANGTSMISPFADLPLAFDDVSLENCRFETPKPLNDLFVACQETAKKVRVSRIFFSEFRPCRVSLGSNLSDTFPDEISQTPLIDLSPCKGLEEIELSLIQLRQPSHWLEPILQTVTSTRVKKITFDTDFPSAAADIDSAIDVHSWSRLDVMFLKMAHMLDPADGKLELVFNAMAPNALREFEPVDPGRFLEWCRTKAVVGFEPKRY